MVFTSTGRTMAHTVFTDTVFVNGVETRFDVPSMVANDRTLMPIRMLAFAIGVDDDGIEWDPSGIVDIWRRTPPSVSNNENQENNAPGTIDQGAPNQSNEPSTPNIPPVANNTNPNAGANILDIAQGNQGAAAGPLAIISAVPSRINHDVGQTVNIVVETSRAVDRVRLTNDRGDVLTEQTAFRDTQQSRTFEISFTPDTRGEIALRVQAGNSAGYLESHTSLSVNVAQGAGRSEMSVFNARLSTTNMNVRNQSRNVLGTVRTDGEEAVRIEILNSSGRRLTTVNRHDRTFGTQRIWEFNFEVETNAPNGANTFIIVAFDRNNNEERMEFTINVTGGASSSDNNNNNNSNERIVSAQLEGASNTVFTGDMRWLTVVTGNDVTEVELRSDGNRQAGTTFGFSTNSGSGLSNNRREFRFSFNADVSGASNYWIHVRQGNEWHSARLTDFISNFNVVD
jgi:hypothetical protein